MRRERSHVSKNWLKKELQRQEKHEREREGWYGLLRLQDIYDFTVYLIEWEWKIREPVEPMELLRAEQDGRFLSLYWDPERQKIHCWRNAMGMILVFYQFRHRSNFLE
ncbi:MAG: hypothetical protein SOZ01_03205 [Selenomonadaceae bacterium]|nr:hypothetical protein [Selenomonadaceae bacterium]MDY3915737.1 hypothetical protein [Selenomonadaceae bacterium]